ncbi:MAG: sigma-54-dependent Fis family transcriptional regulator [Deltaproteobacteria bacterium]|nr:sigma-54-dependent Fis family transcriptional regulator [Deltaproteobacteria bacterium]
MYIRNYIPADHVVLTHYYPEERKHLALATASVRGGSLLNVSIIVPEQAHTLLGRPGIQTQIIERADEFPPAQTWVSKGLMEKDDSLLTLRLDVDEKIIGSVGFVARGGKRFTQEHARLLTLLKEPFAIALSNSLRYRELLELKELLAEDNLFLHNELRQMAGEEIVGADFGLKGVMEMVRQVAPLPSPVLISGETGTGKEVIARAIHKLSLRRHGPFITVNCGAIPVTLMDSELFGHEKGAFTGALARKRGRFERANGGTVFLDEVGELQPEAQVRLLRVLQEKEIERVGGTEAIKVDIRVIAATHRDLKAMVAGETFREDLYFRLNVFPIEMPPLRDRRGDIPALVHSFIRKKLQQIGLRGKPSLEPGALETLMAYNWPGNVRELENAVEKALILTKGKSIAFESLDGTAADQAAIQPALSSPSGSADTLPLDEAASRHIRHVLSLTSGRVGGKKGAADLLQINPSTLRKKMRKLGIPFGRRKASTSNNAPV